MILSAFVMLKSGIIILYTNRFGKGDECFGIWYLKC